MAEERGFLQGSDSCPLRNTTFAAVGEAYTCGRWMLAGETRQVRAEFCVWTG
jgi:hypothetical protein